MLTVQGHLTDLGRTLKSLLCFQRSGIYIYAYIYTPSQRNNEDQQRFWPATRVLTPFHLIHLKFARPRVEQIPCSKFSKFLSFTIGQIANFLPFAKIHNILKLKEFPYKTEPSMNKHINS